MQRIHPSSSEILTLADGRSVSLLEPLGAGRFGTVYRGTLDAAWGIRRAVAVKVIALGAEQDHRAIMRGLGRIARRAVCVRNASFVQVFEVDRTDGVSSEAYRPFVVTELVEGESLASLVAGWRAAGHRVPTDFALMTGLRIAEALGAALFAERPEGSLTGLVHGDLCPRQVLISNEGEVKVTDFGQLLFAEEGSHIRRRPCLDYLAPELAVGAPPDARTDVFSIGAILRELLYGPRFAPGTSTADAMHIARNGGFHTCLLAPNVPPSLRAVVDRATHVNPNARPSHASALAAELRREMHRLGLTDAQTCIRHAVVGWCETSADDTTRHQSEVVPRISYADDDELSA